MMPKSGARYIILNTNQRTGRNELNDLARMVCQTYAQSINVNAVTIELYFGIEYI